MCVTSGLNCTANEYKNTYMYNIGKPEPSMQTVSYTALRSNLAQTMDKVNADHEPVIITRQNGEPAVLMSLEDFRSYEATAYLMASPKNAERLNRAIESVEAGKAQRRELIEE